MANDPRSAGKGSMGAAGLCSVDLPDTEIKVKRLEFYAFATVL
jgi:hypothetical protein